MKNKKIKTLGELRQENERSLHIIQTVVIGMIAMIAMVLLLFLTSILCGCSSRNPARASVRILRQDTTELRQIIRAYNHVLHRVWIDNPNYVEDVLNETDEFCNLNDVLYSQWDDTFTFYNERDSIYYYENWREGR